jgi:hypothetical protein
VIWPIWFGMDFKDAQGKPQLFKLANNFLQPWQPNDASRDTAQLSRRRHMCHPPHHDNTVAK